MRDAVDKISGSPFRTTNGRGGGAYDSDPEESVLSLVAGSCTRDELACVLGD